MTDKNTLSIFPEISIDLPISEELQKGAKGREAAEQIVRSAEKLANGRKILFVDLFGGTGNVSITAALRGHDVIYNDKNPEHFLFAQQAASFYRESEFPGLRSRVTFKNTDAALLAKTLKNTDKDRLVVAFMDPPWRVDYRTGSSERLLSSSDRSYEFSFFPSFVKNCATHCLSSGVSLLMALPLDTKLSGIKPISEEGVRGLSGNISSSLYSFSSNSPQDPAVLKALSRNAIAL